MATSPSTSAPFDPTTSWPASLARAARYARCTLGRSVKRRLRLATTRVTFENGRRREPYPPATVSLLRNPFPPRTSARTIRIHLLTRVASAPVSQNRMKASIAACLGAAGRPLHAKNGGLARGWRGTRTERGREAEPRRGRRAVDEA